MRRRPLGRSSARGRIRLAAAAVLAGLAAGASASAQTPGFDHDRTRFPLVGRHERTACESCHVGGRFTGTPTRCAYCHDGSTKWAITARPPAHFPTTAACDDCHTARTWAQARMEHATTSGRCETCHNGAFASGRSPRHPPTTSPCENCHGTATWATARFDHSDVAPGTCASCHNGIIATGKHPGHIASSSQCDLCHSTRAWTPATGFDHSGVAPGTCASCHNGVTATGMGSGHFATVLACDRCHATTTWTGVRYVHLSAAYPGEHRRSLGCLDCHTANAQSVPWPAPALQPDCGGCHLADFESGPHRKHASPDVRYTASELRDCSGSCHVYTDATLTTILESRTGEHRVSDGEF